jgi:hypothetical protein
MKVSIRGTVITLVVVGIVVLCGVFSSHMLAGLKSMDSMSSCSESSQSQLAGPDKKYVVEVFVRNCGATTGYVTHVNLRDAGKPFAPDQNGVISAGEIASVEGTSKVHLTWVQASILNVQVSLEENRGAVNTVDSWGPVHIKVHN